MLSVRLHWGSALHASALIWLFKLTARTPPPPAQPTPHNLSFPYCRCTTEAGLAGLKSTGMRMHAGMCVVDASSVFSVLTFLYMTALNTIAYCDDLQGLMSANSQ